MESDEHDEEQTEQVEQVEPSSDILQTVKFQYYNDSKVYSPGLLAPHKGKYYKQTYRTAWEQMPDFKGWLRGIPGEPTRAFCMYCQKSLHAHRLSLLKHTCTIRHQKAAQINFIRQQKQLDNDESSMEPVNIVIASSSQEDDDELQHSVEYETVGEDGEMQENIEEEEEEVELEEYPQLVHKAARQQTRATVMSTKPVISTHVLDTTKGQPVSGLQVSLYKLIDGRWTYINEGLTNPDGRFSNFMSRDDFTAGRYKIHFDVDRYFELRKQDSLYPFIEIVFDCRSPVENYHIPLLLGPFGYTTYRGS